MDSGPRPPGPSPPGGGVRASRASVPRGRAVRALTLTLAASRQSRQPSCVWQVMQAREGRSGHLIRGETSPRVEEQNAVCGTASGEAVALQSPRTPSPRGHAGSWVRPKAGDPHRCLGLSGFKTPFQGTCETHGPQGVSSLSPAPVTLSRRD